jgi:L-lactate utilization protein LutC
MTTQEIDNYGQWVLDNFSNDLPSKWKKFPSERQIQNTIDSVKRRNIDVYYVKDKKEALEKIKELVPNNSSVMTGSSTTLYQIGFMKYYLLEENPWVCLGPEIYQEENLEKRTTLQRKSEIADYFIASVNAIAETGQLVATDASGSRVSAYPYAAKNIILVVGVQKITKDLEEAMNRIREYVYPLEDKRARKAYGIPSIIGKWVIIEEEKQDHRIKLVLVNEELGF